MKHNFYKSEHGHSHHRHDNTHGVIDASLFTTDRGIWAVKWSFFWLFITAAFQIIVVFLSRSVALFADTIHNFGDAATAVPLWIAFKLTRRKATNRFTYGYGRVEDLAGVAVVLTILFSAIVAGYQSFERLIHPQKIECLWVVMIASIIGFLGNEAVALFRIKVGKEIGSAALIADGYHARVDGLTSLAVLGGAVGVWLGYPMADPIVGMLITIAILWIVWDSAKLISARLLDAVDPQVVDDIRHAVRHVNGVQDVVEIRVRWLGHRLHAEVNVVVNKDFSVTKGHEIAYEVRHQLLHHLKYLSNATIHIDPVDAPGEDYHGVANHTHDNLPEHSHFSGLKNIIYVCLLTSATSFLTSCATVATPPAWKSHPSAGKELSGIVRNNAIHIVAPGETVWRVSKMYDVPIKDIARENNLGSSYQLKEGQRLIIPNAAPIKPIVSLYSSKKWEYIIIHHSATDDGNSLDFNKLHKRKGWKRIGYHFVIDNGTRGKQDGQIETSPRWIKQEDGAHCKSSDMNSIGIGICLVGNFSEEKVSEKQMESLAYLVNILSNHYKIPKEHIIGHGKLRGAKTECPGKYFPWNEFWNKLESSNQEVL